jgi:cardiolipin synthase (CMP-forming)
VTEHAPRKRAWSTIPNLITIGRIGMVPAFVALSLTGHTVAALWTFIVAAASDGIDGLLARLLDQRSHLGGILDPIADKALVLSALLVLVFTGRLPWWLLALVVLRDGWMAIGALMVKHKRLEIPTAPSRVGKYATLGLLTSVVLALVDQAVGKSELLEAYIAVVGFLAGMCVAASTVQYFHRFGYLFWAPPKSEGA